MFCNVEVHSKTNEIHSEKTAVHVLFVLKEAYIPVNETNLVACSIIQDIPGSWQVQEALQHSLTMGNIKAMGRHGGIDEKVDRDAKAEICTAD